MLGDIPLSLPDRQCQPFGRYEQSGFLPFSMLKQVTLTGLCEFSEAELQRIYDRHNSGLAPLAYDPQF
ncbi:hypothetical protein O6379_24235, partial [Salmonella enterica subsp. enterica]|nr:hypothetical protein [Salmonella enterica]